MQAERSERAEMQAERSERAEMQAERSERAEMSQTVNLLTGPPRNRADDSATLECFLRMTGLKAVCGGTTARLVANYLNVPLVMEGEIINTPVPPQYGIKGIDLATEGVITLNQVYNMLDENIESQQEANGAVALRLLLGEADELNIIVGLAENSAHTDVLFRQRGILPRHELMPLLAEKLRQKGKLVSIRFV